MTRPHAPNPAAGKCWTRAFIRYVAIAIAVLAGIAIYLFIMLTNR